MRQGRALVLALLVGSLAGCVSSETTRQGGWLNRILRPAGPSGADAVQIDFALVERPVGDPYLNRDLWTAADEQVVALETRAILEDNGFRIGQVGGITPVELQALLTSERSCANPRRLRCLSGKATKLTLSDLAVCRFNLQREGEATPVQVQQAQCSLEVVPTLTADGRTKLSFIPQVHHGQTSFLPRPAADLSGWIWKEERPTERYAQLKWDVTLAPNEYVLVGGRFDKPETLGNQCFVSGSQTAPVQRLLVIRTTRNSQPLPEAVTPVATGAGQPRPLASLASQAGQPTARGTAP